MAPISPKHINLKTTLMTITQKKKHDESNDSILRDKHKSIIKDELASHSNSLQKLITNTDRTYLPILSINK